jgi:hypothetical protein
MLSAALLLQACITAPRPMDAQEQAVWRGLEWAAGFLADDETFDALAPDYLLMLRELGLNHRHTNVQWSARKLESLAARRLAHRLPRVFPANRHGKERFLAASRFLFRHNDDRAHLERYYRIALADIGLDDTVRFDRALAGLRYSELTDILLNAWHVHQARLELADLELPPDRLPRYLARLKDINFIHDRRRAGRYSLQNYFVTHLVFVLSDFGAVAPPDTALARRLLDYLLARFEYVRREADDNDLLAEFVHCLKIYGMDSGARVVEAQRYLQGRQNEDGSFITTYELGGNAYDLFHPTWTAITALNYSSASQQRSKARP